MIKGIVPLPAIFSIRISAYSGDLLFGIHTLAEMTWPELGHVSLSCRQDRHPLKLLVSSAVHSLPSRCVLRAPTSTLVLSFLSLSFLYVKTLKEVQETWSNVCISIFKHYMCIPVMSSVCFSEPKSFAKDFSLLGLWQGKAPIYSGCGPLYTELSTPLTPHTHRTHTPKKKSTHKQAHTYTCTHAHVHSS